MRRAGKLISPRIVMAAVLLLPAGTAWSGGPLIVGNNGAPFVWNTTTEIQYRTDDGRLSVTVDEPTARGRVLAMFNVWENVPSSNIGYDRRGFISPVGAYNGGDVDTLAEYDAVDGACGDGDQSPIVYDDDGVLFDGLGIDKESVIGFAGPCALNIAGVKIVSGEAVMNGLFQDGRAAPVGDISAGEFDAAFIHEFGHFSGLDHSQINRGCVTGVCAADDLAGLPTMFPFLVDASQAVLSNDDVAWISKLYPQTTGGASFANTHGTITGVVFFSDGQSHVQNVNVIARRVDTGSNEDRREAVSGISGYKFSYFHGNPINDPGDNFGSHQPGDIGLFEIPVPPGDYTVEVEFILSQFVDGSSVGGAIRFPFPGTSPAPIGPNTMSLRAPLSLETT